MIAFGPIPSRRLGKSLGINNIVSHKVCSYGCIYCQIGGTVNKSVKRELFYEPEKLLENVEKHLMKLDKDYLPDYLTFVANGEPTLDINLGKEIKLLKKIGIPIAVITNSSLTSNKSVQEDLMKADWVSLKVDSVEETVWKKVNRPSESVDFEKMLEGLMSFASVYKGRLHTETMLIKGFNDSIIHMERNASFIAKLNPEKAYLSIPTRPPAVKETEAVTEEKITEAWQIYQNAGIITELLTGFEGSDTGSTGNCFEDILNITAVHPLREDTIIKLLQKTQNSLYIIDSLLSQGLIKGVKYQGKTYYVRNYHF